jgi:hypothetical protein
MAPRYFVGIASVAWAAGSAPARAACTITDLAPTGVVPVPMLGPEFSFVATHDCVTLAFLAEGGTVTKTPVQRGVTPGAGLRYVVTLSGAEWAAVTDATNETLTWSIVGTTAGGESTRTTTTNALDLDGDGIERPHDCDDADSSALRCSLALDDYDLWIETSPGQQISTWDMQVPDLTGDGTADLLLANFALDDEGAVFILDGTAPPTNVEDGIPVRSRARDKGFGENYDTGDADGDGFADLLVSAPRNAVPTVYLFHGPITAETDSGGAHGSLLVQSGDFVADIGLVTDHDGDGSSDIAVGLSSFGDEQQGAVVVAAGIGEGMAPLSAESTHVYRGTRNLAGLGEQVVDVGDIDGDGVSELAIGASSSRRLFGVSVYVVPGGGAPGSYAVDDVASATLEEAYERWTLLGHRILGPDYDGDGLSDLVVSAPFRNVEWDDYAGAVFAFLGPVTGALTPDDAPIRWEGRDEESVNLGRGVADGDADGDGQTDLVMTSAGTHAAFLQLGLATGVVESNLLVPLETGSFGDVWIDGSAFIPDWTGDGKDEIAFGLTNQAGPGGVPIGGEYIFFSDRLY